MYIHIGGEYTIAARFIVGIFDLDRISGERDKGTKKFLARMEETMRLEYVSADLPRSLIVTLDRAYLSPISTTTLKQRIIDGSENGTILS